jgi:hypothetical protein
MVLAHVALEDLHLQLRTDVPHLFPEAVTDVTAEQLLAVFGDPHEVRVVGLREILCGFLILINSISKTLIVRLRET